MRLLVLKIGRIGYVSAVIEISGNGKSVINVVWRQMMKQSKKQNTEQLFVCEKSLIEIWDNQVDDEVWNDY